MERIPMWLGIGAVTAGVSAAALAGAGAAAADTEPDGPGPSAASSAEQSDPGPAAGTATTTDDDIAPDAEPEQDVEEEDVEPEEPVEEVPEEEEEPVEEPLEEEPAEEEPVVEEPVDEEPVREEPAEDELVDDTPQDDLPVTVDEEPVDEAPAATEPEKPAVPVDVTDEQQPLTPDETAPEAGYTAAVMSRQIDEPGVAAEQFVAPLSVPALPTPLPSPFPLLQQLPPVFKALGSVVFDVLGVVAKAFTGPPQLPPGSTVAVRTSTLEIADGRRVSADWYFPDTDEPPTRIIYLQHGFLANGTMYSHTAAYLAERTNSVVVAPTLSSNPFRSDDFWLGGDPMYRAVAELFTGDREALSASAAAAGYTTRYGATATLPRDFALVGHSLGGGLVAGVSGHYARFVTANGEANHLAGVISLDGVPPRDDIVRDSLQALDASGTYVPFLELHAPTNYLNSTSNITQALNAGRAGVFHGVVLNGGAHMDAMLGGNPVIQLAAYVVAGFPKPQNPPAAQHLMAGWINDMFADRIDADTGTCTGADCTGTYGLPGSRVEIPTGKGTATATVLGTPVATPRPSIIPVSLWQQTRSVLLPVA